MLLYALVSLHVEVCFHSASLSRHLLSSKVIIETNAIVSSLFSWMAFAWPFLLVSFLVSGLVCCILSSPQLYVLLAVLAQR